MVARWNERDKGGPRLEWPAPTIDDLRAHHWPTDRPAPSYLWWHLPSGWRQGQLWRIDAEEVTGDSGGLVTFFVVTDKM